MKKLLILLTAVVACLGGVSAQAKEDAVFSRFEVEKPTVSPRSVIIMGGSDILSFVNFTFTGVLIKQEKKMGDNWVPVDAFEKVYIIDKHGYYIGTSIGKNQQGEFIVPFDLTVFTASKEKVYVAGLTKSDLNGIDHQSVRLQTGQFFYDGSVVNVIGQYPGGEGVVDASLYQNARVVLSRNGNLSNVRVPIGRKVLVDVLTFNVEFEDVTLEPLLLENVTQVQGDGRPYNMVVWLTDGNGKTIARCPFIFPKNARRGSIPFTKPLKLKQGINTFRLYVVLGGSFKHGGSVAFLFPTEKMRGVGKLTGEKVAVFSDLVPSQNIITSRTLVGYKP